LLEGLIDTDGHINRRGLFEYSTVSTELANDFLTLVRSLGIPVNYRLHSRENDPDSYSDTPIHRITELKGYNHGDKIVDVNLTDQFVEMQCIKVSSPEHLYITDNFITTHNTTTTMVLLKSLFNEGLKHIEKGNNGIKLYNELQDLASSVVKTIDEVKEEVTLDSVRDVALISANGDEEVADVVHRAVTSLGEDSYVKIEDGYSKETVLDIVDGSVYFSGFKSFGPQGVALVTDEARYCCELNAPAIVLYAGKLTDAGDVQHIFELVMGKDFKDRTDVLIIANDFSDDVRNYILKSRIHGKLPVCALKAISDGSPNSRTEILYDLAAKTGATLAAKGIKDVKDLTLEDIGGAEHVEVYLNETVIYDGFGDEAELKERVGKLKVQLENVDAEFDKDNLRVRIAKILGGVGIIRVGGVTETEIAEKKDRVEDALCAARAALKDGIVSGGGMCLYDISKTIKGDSVAEKIMHAALEAPIRKIIENTGESPDAILAKMPKNKGFDAKNKKYVDMKGSGIIDAALVTKCAILNSVSVAGLLLTTGGSIVMEKSKLQDGQPNPFAGLM